jgi:Cu-Zn family superoxide dismutase
MGKRTLFRTTAVLLAPALLAWTAMAAVPVLGAESRTTGASAELKNARGEVVGQALLLPTGTGGRLEVQVKGFSDAKAGEHGIHIHTVGSCTAPDFASAGGHFNPTAKKHGLNNPEGHHAGDLLNIMFDGAGNATFGTAVEGIAFEAGAAGSIFDADGSAVVIHAGPDDMVSDPAGNSGARIACGVFAAYAVPAGMPSTGIGDPGLYLWAGSITAIILVSMGLTLARTRTRRAQQ